MTVDILCSLGSCPGQTWPCHSEDQYWQYSVAICCRGAGSSPIPAGNCLFLSYGRTVRFLPHPWELYPPEHKRCWLSFTIDGLRLFNVGPPHCVFLWPQWRKPTDRLIHKSEQQLPRRTRGILAKIQTGKSPITFNLQIQDSLNNNQNTPLLTLQSNGPHCRTSF